jgi:hypothetical protein
MIIHESMCTADNGRIPIIVQAGNDDRDNKIEEIDVS